MFKRFCTTTILLLFMISLVFSQTTVKVDLGGTTWDVTFTKAQAEIPPDPDDIPDLPGLVQRYFPPDVAFATKVFEFTSETKKNLVTGNGEHKTPAIFKGNEIRFKVNIDLIPENLRMYKYRLVLHTIGTPCSSLGDWKKREYPLYTSTDSEGKIITGLKDMEFVITKDQLMLDDIQRDAYIMITDTEIPEGSYCYFTSKKYAIGFTR